MRYESETGIPFFRARALFHFLRFSGIKERFLIRWYQIVELAGACFGCLSETSLCAGLGLRPDAHAPHDPRDVARVVEPAVVRALELHTQMADRLSDPQLLLPTQRA